MSVEPLVQACKLFDLLNCIETDLGLSCWSEDERRIIYALVDLGKNGQHVPSRSVREHLFCRNIATPTFYRALRKLTDSGKIRVPNGRKAGVYVLCK